MMIMFDVKIVNRIWNEEYVILWKMYLFFVYFYSFWYDMLIVLVFDDYFIYILISKMYSVCVIIKIDGKICYFIIFIN